MEIVDVGQRIHGIIRDCNELLLLTTIIEKIIIKIYRRIDLKTESCGDLLPGQKKT